MGFNLHLQWGPSLIFTFGPYGFADYTINFYHLTAFIAVVFGLAVTWGLAALIILALRKSWGLMGAGVAAWAAIAIASNMTGYSDVAADTALALALAALASDQAKCRLVLLSLLGALAGFDILVKFNDGLVSMGLIIVSIGVARNKRLQTALAAGVPFVTVFLVAWLGAGQNLSNLPTYVRGSLSVAAGYGEAMGEQGALEGEVLAALMAVLLAAMFASALGGRPRREQVATVTMLAGWGWALLKEGFVRADTDHNAAFFGLVLVAFCLVRLKRSLLPFQVCAVVLAAIVACHETGSVPRQLHSPVGSASALANELATTLLPGHFAQAQASARHEFLSSGAGLTPTIISLLEGNSVAVEPAQNSVAYSYPQLYWDPEPVLQAYSAYTSYLDNLDAAFLASSRAPERILFQTGWTIDDRYPYFDPPATLESMYCRYIQIAVSGSSQVLARVPNRCGPAVRIGRSTAHFGQVIVVPRAAGRMVLATFSLTMPLETRVTGLLLRSPPVEIEVWSSHPRPVIYRFIPSTALDDHVLSVPAALGYSSLFTPTSVHRIELSGDGWQAVGASVNVTFYAQSLAR